MQVWVVPWMPVSDAQSAGLFADAVAAAPRQLFGGGTSISGAITHAAALFARAPFTAPRRVIDISGDGANNRGVPAELARDTAIAQGITINGLPILSLEPELDIYYRDHVIGGPRAFLIVAQGFESFADAILRKLILEIADRDAPNPAAWVRKSEAICHVAALHRVGIMPPRHGENRTENETVSADRKCL